jgi:predicted phage terminase large subunit-like protein
LLLIDDPLKNSMDAASAIVRRTQQEWYASTFYTRAEPDAAMIVIQTRWHEEDLSGWLLQEEVRSDAPERWHIVSLPAIYEGADPPFPDSCTVEAEWRTSGEPLCPERFDAKRLTQIRARLGSYFWSALYQQQPRPADGLLFQRQWFPIVEVAPAQGNRMRYWDTAATANGGDYTVGVRLLQTTDGFWYVEDVVRGQWSPNQRDTVIRQTAETDGKRVAIQIEQEPGSSGVAVADTFRTLLAGFTIRATKPSGSKLFRAGPFASQCEGNRVRLVQGAWNKAFIEELVAFPTAAHDDQVDAVCGAFIALTGSKYITML